MIVSTSNVASQSTVTIAPTSALLDTSVLVDSDFSSVYNSAFSSGTVTITFALNDTQDINYVAIGGSNASKKASITIHADGVEVLSDSNLSQSESKVMYFPIMALEVDQIVITITGTGTLSIADIAMGSHYEIPRGEQSGFSYPWSVPNISTRSATGLHGAPIAVAYESRRLKTVLRIPNNLKSTVAGWNTFIEFAASNTFYVLRDEDKFESCAGFNAEVAMSKAHQSTRMLIASAISFSAFARNTEALF